MFQDQDRAHEVTEDLCEMGKRLGFTPEQWAIILGIASQLTAHRHGFAVQVAPLPNDKDCQCAKCTEARKGKNPGGLHVVKH